MKREAERIRCLEGSTAPRMNLIHQVQFVHHSKTLQFANLSNAAPRTISVNITVLRWYATTDHAS